jgi:hypothetical protein
LLVKWSTAGCGIVGRGSKRNGLMVLKEETADVVLFGRSVDGERSEQVPRVHSGRAEAKRARVGVCVE